MNILGFSFIHLSAPVAAFLGPFANLYTVIGNLFLLVVVIYITARVFGVILTGVRDHSGESADGMDSAAHGKAARRTVNLTVELLAIGFALFMVVIHGADLLYFFANEAGKLLTVSTTDPLPTLVGPLFGKFVATAQTYLGMTIILVGLFVMAKRMWHGLQQVKHKDSAYGGKSGDALKGAVQNTATVGGLVVFGFLAVHFGPTIMLEMLKGANSIVSTVPLN